MDGSVTDPISFVEDLLDWRECVAQRSSEASCNGCVASGQVSVPGDAESLEQPE